MTRKKILVVDDSRTALMVELMALRSGPFEIVTAGDGEEAIAKVRAERPDLVLLDLVMPRMDGLEACRRLREDPSTRTTPIIMVTTRGEMDSIEAGYASGCSDYVTKPIDRTELLAKVNSLLGLAQG